jgi:nucleoside phosphorylase
MTQPFGKNCPLIVCITDSEYDAVRKIFSPDDGARVETLQLERGYIGSRSVSVCRISEMGSKGRDSLAQSLGPVIDAVKPSFVVELGICFGLKSDFHIGDIGICQYAADYEYQKVNPDEIQHRVRTVKSDAALYSALLSFAARKKDSFNAVGAVYACGDKVVNNPVLKTEVLAAVPDAKCGDMESYALGVVCENRGVRWALIKASSDDGVNKGDEYQRKAAENSTQFFAEFLKEADGIDEYFEVAYEVDFKDDTTDYSNISTEVFGSAPSKSESIKTARDSLIVHHHPDLEGEWVIAYVYKAHSVPESLRALVKHFRTCPARIEVCIASRSEVTAIQREGYEKILKKAGCKKIYLATIGDFIFDRIIEKRTSSQSVRVAQDYVDQRVYRDNQAIAAGRAYASSFLERGAGNWFDLKPISVILGQGGVGKTTFCSNLVNWINSGSRFRMRMLLVTKGEVMRNYSGEPINSIVDLYNEYIRGAEGQSAISQTGFSLALRCGSIVMLIDGIDEIESACGDKFNMGSFVESVSALNESLNSCRVVLTSRDTSASKFERLSNADVVYLKGFDDDDVSEYISKEPQGVQRQIRDIIPRIKTKANFVNPYLLHVARQFLLGAVSGNLIDTARLNLSDPFDYILARAIQREVEKQTLGIKIDDYYDLLNEIVVERANAMDFAYFEEYIKVILVRGAVSDSQNVSQAYLKFFLLMRVGENVVVSHDEYVAHIMLNRVHKVLGSPSLPQANDVRSVELIFGGMKPASFGIRERLSARLLAEDANEASVVANLRAVIGQLKTEAQRAPVLMKERAIYELHLFAFDFLRTHSAIERREVLDKLHAPKRFDHLYVLGAFPSIDFSDCTIEQSHFRNCSSFFLNTFNENTSFRSCGFVDCVGKFKRESLLPEIFDESCHMDDGMKAQLASGSERRVDTAMRTKSDIKQVLKVFRQGLGFGPIGINRIKAQTNLALDRGYDAFVASLCLHGILQPDTAPSIYRVSKAAEVDAMALCDEDHVQGVVASAINSLAGK